jgi:hypothetical protein
MAAKVNHFPCLRYLPFMAVLGSGRTIKPILDKALQDNGLRAAVEDCGLVDLIRAAMREKLQSRRSVE